MGSRQCPRFNVNNIAVIGAGPCGLSAVKYLKAQGTFAQITVFEQRDEVGGVWNYSELVPAPSCPVPQLDPFLTPDLPIAAPNSHEQPPVFPSPMYGNLHTNIPGQLMQFVDKPFPEGLKAFPSREKVQQYLLEYAEDVRDHIKFCYQVKAIEHFVSDGFDKWRIETQSTWGGALIKDVFDAVVVANGHYATPFIPDIKNISQFHKTHPSNITHSKYYRTPDSFNEKRVIVVGNGPSGIDIALQINKVCKQPALLSVKQPTPQERLAHTGCKEVPQIAEFLVDQRGVRFQDGTVETDIDAVVLCTGFLFSYPFLHDLNKGLITNGKGVHGLYKHLFNINYPTLVFPGLNIKAVPWPLSEAQAAVYAAVWSNRLDLPKEEKMLQWSRDLETEKNGDALHVFKTLEDGYYINEMHDWAMKATHVAKKPPYWDDSKFWERKNYAEAKLLFEQQGCKAMTLRELGLYYDPDKIK